MNEIYWITVLSKLRTVALIIFPMVTGVTILCVCILFSTMSSAYDTDEIDEIAKRKIKKIAIPSLIVGFIMLIVVVLIPSKQDMYLIYGAGNVIDYCQDNPKVKELPDKAVEALDIWLDMVNEKKE